MCLVRLFIKELRSTILIATPRMVVDIRTHLSTMAESLPVLFGEKNKNEGGRARASAFVVCTCSGITRA